MKTLRLRRVRRNKQARSWFLFLLEQGSPIMAMEDTELETLSGATRLKVQPFMARMVER